MQTIRNDRVLEGLINSILMAGFRLESLYNEIPESLQALIYSCTEGDYSGSRLFPSTLINVDGVTIGEILEGDLV